jgi:alkylhydroperoxidase family enzyme
MAAVVSQANDSPFCVAAHSATSTRWFGDAAKVAGTLANLGTAPLEEPLRTTLCMLAKLASEHSIDADDIRAVLAAGATAAQVRDALAVALAFGITARLANAFSFSVANSAAMTAGAQHLLKRGYR